MRALWSVVALVPLLACVAQSAPEGATAEAELARADAGSSTDGGFTADGEPVREACTTTFGSDLGGTWQGRLDGYLTAIVPSTTHGCKSDRSHLHLQIRMSGKIYDVAVNVDDVKLAEIDAPLLDGEWSEGWHPNMPVDYVSDLGLHSSSFRGQSQANLERTLTTAFASANHVSIYATRYARSGVHLVHRARRPDVGGRQLDGAIVLRPTTGNPHYLLFSFPDQRF